jgi:hypothetical protein
VYSDTLKTRRSGDRIPADPGGRSHAGIAVSNPTEVRMIVLCVVQ